MNEKRKRFLVDLIFGAVIAGVVIVINAGRGHAVTRLICDGCFVAGVLLLGTGGLKFFRNEGMFDIFAYSVKSVFQIHYPFAKMHSHLEEKKPEGFAAYKERKREARKPAGDLLWAGLVYMGLAAVFFAVYLLVPVTTAV